MANGNIFNPLEGVLDLQQFLQLQQTQEQSKQQQRQQALLANPQLAAATFAGQDIGSGLAGLFGGGPKISDQERLARSNQEALDAAGKFVQSLDKELFAGKDGALLQQHAQWRAAADELRKRGNLQDAARFEIAASQVEEQLTERAKTRAELLETGERTEFLRAQRDQLRATDPAKNEITQLQNQRESQRTIANNPNVSADRRAEARQNINELTGRIAKLLEKNAGTVINLPSNKAEGEFAKTLGKETAANFTDQAKAAGNARVTLLQTNEIAKLLNEGIRTGTLADIRQGIGTAIVTLGLGDSTQRDVTARTDAFLSATAQRTLSMIKESEKALGSGSGFSQRDLELMERAAGSTIGMDDASLRRILEIGREASVRIGNAYNEQRDFLLQGPNGEQVQNLTQSFVVPELVPLARGPGARDPLLPNLGKDQNRVDLGSGVTLEFID